MEYTLVDPEIIITFANDQEMIEWLGRAQTSPAITGFERLKAQYPPPRYTATLNLADRTVVVYDTTKQE